MKSHLTEEQISAWISGERNEETAKHLHECSTCMAEVESTAGALLLFRDSGFQGAEYWQSQPSPQPSARFGEWAMASVVVMIAFIGVVVLRQPAPPSPVQAPPVFV